MSGRWYVSLRSSSCILYTADGRPGRSTMTIMSCRSSTCEPELGLHLGRCCYTMLSNNGDRFFDPMEATMSHDHVTWPLRPMNNPIILVQNDGARHARLIENIRLQCQVIKQIIMKHRPCTVPKSVAAFLPPKYSLCDDRLVLCFTIQLILNFLRCRLLKL